MNLRAGAAVLAAQLVGWVSRVTGRGGGTALPGLIAEKFDPGLLAHLAGQLPQGAVVVTGTNGKTTTSHMLAGILRRAGWTPIRNASGSNLARGIVTTLAAHARWDGQLVAAPRAVGLFETDEAAFTGVVPAVRPRVIAVTNLFRDQLDRYGEVDTVAGWWRQALAKLPSDAPPLSLVLNADDPAVAALAGWDGASRGEAGAACYFGVDDARWGHPGLEHAADAKVCPACGALLEYPLCFYGHLGHYHCANGHTRPVPAVRAKTIELRGLEGAELTLATPRGELLCKLPLAGLHNVYNALAAAAAALALDIPLEVIRAGLEGTTAAFGRLERVPVGDRVLYLVLAKNPVGMNQALRTLFVDGAPKRLLVALNDLDADGRDISWIWDADFEQMAGHVADLVISGRRADDLALRLKYAGALDGVPYVVEPELAKALDRTISSTTPGETIYAVVTYTAMLAVRRVLTERDYVAAFWKDE